jgi:hypothetical protein
VPEGYRIDHVIANLWDLLPLLGLTKEAL